MRYSRLEHDIDEALAVVLGFVFGYALTVMPLLRAGIAYGSALARRCLGYGLDHDHGDRG